jgi:hypothetical protein
MLPRRKMLKVSLAALAGAALPAGTRAAAAIPADTSRPPVEVVDGDPWREMLASAPDEESGLILIGRHPRHGCRCSEVRVADGRATLFVPPTGPGREGPEVERAARTLTELLWGAPPVPEPPDFEAFIDLWIPGGPLSRPPAMLDVAGGVATVRRGMHAPRRPVALDPAFVRQLLELVADEG